MKKRLMIIAIGLCVSFMSQLSRADFCPVAEGLNPETPPGGWILFNSPQFEGDNSQPQNFHFVSSTHSLSKTYFFQQVFCQYETCSTYGCPNFTLISTITYKQPAVNISPWNTYPTLTNTVVCQPTDYDPLQCVFTNLATQ